MCNFFKGAVFATWTIMVSVYAYDAGIKYQKEKQEKEKQEKIKTLWNACKNEERSQ